MKLIKGMPTGNVLDIGCGAGDLCETMHKRGNTVLGIDFSEDAIAYCNQRLKKIADNKMRFDLKDFHELTETFDLIFMCEVLEHIENDQESLATVHSLLNPGGRLILSVPANRKWFGPSDVYAGHYRRYDKDELIDLFQKCGFAVETIWSYGVPLANLTEVIRNIVFAKDIPRSKEEGTKRSGVKRNVEAKFRFFLNDFFLYPFYIMQAPFFYSNIGTGFIVKAVKR